jgi:PKD repeat protein
LTFTWDFDDGSEPIDGQITQHTFTRPAVFDVTLTVCNEPCPTITKCVTEIEQVRVLANDNVYLPLVAGAFTVSETESLTLAPFAQLTPGQVRVVWGSAHPGDGVTRLTWHAVQGDEELIGYRVYRRALGAGGAFQHVATVPVGVHGYTDNTADCGQSYYVTAFNAVGESPPSATSYFSLPCQE